jgi:hypothetical protein
MIYFDIRAESFFRFVSSYLIFISIAYVMDALFRQITHIFIWFVLFCHGTILYFTCFTSFPKLFLVLVLNVWVSSNLDFTVILVIQVTRAFMKCISVWSIFIGWLHLKSICFLFIWVYLRGTHLGFFHCTKYFIRPLTVLLLSIEYCITSECGRYVSLIFSTIDARYLNII